MGEKKRKKGRGKRRGVKGKKRKENPLTVQLYFSCQSAVSDSRQGPEELASV